MNKNIIVQFKENKNLDTSLCLLSINSDVGDRSEAILLWPEAGKPCAATFQKQNGWQWPP